MPKKMNLASPNLTKQKKNPMNTIKCHTKKNLRDNKMSQHFHNIFFISNCGRSQFDIIILFFTSTVFLQQIFGKKLSIVLKLCIKKKTNKMTTQENCV